MRRGKTPLAKTIALCFCLLLTGLLTAGCSSRAERAKNHYENGKHYLAEKNYPKARIELRNAVQNDPKMVEAWRGLSQVAEHEKNWSALGESLRHIVELDKKDVEARVQLAKLYVLGGSLDQALHLANEATELEPEKPSVLALKAAVLFRLKDNEGSEKEAEKALKIDPSNPEANIVLATEKNSKGDYQDALKLLDNVAAAHQNDLGVIFVRLSVYDKMGNSDKVESLLRKLVDLYPKNNAFRNQLVRFYLLKNRPQDAEREMRSVVAADPNNANAELELVRLLAVIKGPAAARAELDFPHQRWWQNLSVADCPCQT